MGEEMNVSMSWIAKQLVEKGIEERQARRLFEKMVEFLEMSPNDFKKGKQFSIDVNLAKYIIWLIDQMDKPFLANTLKGGESTIEEVKEFYEAQLDYIQTIDDKEFREEVKNLAEGFLMTRTQSLYNETMSRVKKAAELVMKLPLRQRVEAILETNAALDQWIEALENCISNAK